ncbi:unnamed protein product [Rhizoctonia solani]|uniref:Protein kinase domain-containing protein n=1 Tax=Rhizoctonia solani TaxID=456999 RepID=A0A8H2WL79_9AGAM|nr:unnamed protein product [Rhizoctonia solani]
MKRRSFILTSILQIASLKLIDFGIAKAIANDTTNIRREHQVGTLNCMNPESIKETQTANGRRLKLIYGRPPFYSITGAVSKLRAISDPNHIIDCPTESVSTVPANDKEGVRQIPKRATPVSSDIINTLKGCLARDPKQRSTIPHLLDDLWLRSWKYTTVSQPEVPKLKESEAIVTEAWLKQTIEDASKEPIEDGALDEEAVQQMAQNLLPALRLANTKYLAYSRLY